MHGHVGIGGTLDCFLFMEPTSGPNIYIIYSGVFNNHRIFFNEVPTYHIFEIVG